MCKTKKGCDVLECGQQNWGYGCYIVPNSCESPAYYGWDYAAESTCPSGDYKTTMSEAKLLGHIKNICYAHNTMLYDKDWCSALVKALDKTSCER